MAVGEPRYEPVDEGTEPKLAPRLRVGLTAVSVAARGSDEARSEVVGREPDPEDFDRGCGK